eukprot:COSAG02_NODE_42_length_46522_cov_109.704478_25_plen_104_part_00
MQGCGYRWLAKHCTALQTLQISLSEDKKRQLICRLRVDEMHVLTLHDGALSDQQAEPLCRLIGRAAQLRSVRLIGWSKHIVDEVQQHSPAGVDVLHGSTVKQR